MPYKRRRIYTKKVVVKPKVHWSLYKRADAGTISPPTKNSATGQFDAAYVTSYDSKALVSAAADSINAPGASKKIKHLKIEVTRSFTVDNDVLHKALTKMKAYVLYMPQGVAFSGQSTTDQIAETILQHPEWIMAEKVLNCNYKSDQSTVSNCTINCKLSRNLKSGDQIILVIATMYNTVAIGSNNISTMTIPYNIEYSFAQTF